MTRTASISTTLPDAGKPTGRCEECGPHGNGGRVELLFSVVDCLDPARVWGRRVKVTCTYSTATDLSVLVGPPDPRPLPAIDPGGLGVTPDPCCLCGVMTFGRPRAQTPTGAWYHVGPCP